MNTLSISILLVVAVCSITANNTDSTDEVINYLVEYGYLESKVCTKLEFKKSLRQLQRENNFKVNGRITFEVLNLIEQDKDRKMVINYLKTYNYLNQNPTPLEVFNSVKRIQENTGVLEVNGLINAETINFIKAHPIAFFEPPI